MKVFLTGQGGFIGSRLRAGLLARGHHVPPLRIEFRTADSPAAWLPYLADVDVVVNVAVLVRVIFLIAELQKPANAGPALEWHS